MGAGEGSSFLCVKLLNYFPSLFMALGFFFLFLAHLKMEVARNQNRH